MSMSNENTQEKQKAIDSILDDALDELDNESEDEDVTNISSSPKNTSKTDVDPDERCRNHLPDDSNIDIQEQTDFLGGSFQDLVKNLSQMNLQMGESEGMAPDLLQNLLSELQSSQNPDGPSSIENLTEPMQTNTNKKNIEKNPSDSDLDKKVEKILNDMSKIGDTANMPQMEELGGGMMESMMKEFENMGNKEDSDEVVEGMMKQLISKEIMYEPIKKVTERFPIWLAEKKKCLSDEEYNRYGNQYQYFQRIVAIYENDPENFPRLMELLQDVQEYGQPPAEIIKELAPDLDLDEDGMPKMDMGFPAMFPGNNTECPMM